MMHTSSSETEHHDGRDISSLRFVSYQLATLDREAHRAHAVELIEAAAGLLVSEYVDHRDNTVHWKRPPAIRSLSDAIKLPEEDRGFNAMMLPDPATTLHRRGGFEMVIPLLRHYEIPLWTPITAGPVDFDSEFHLRLLEKAAYPPCTCGALR